MIAEEALLVVTDQVGLQCLAPLRRLRLFARSDHGCAEPAKPSLRDSLV